MAETLWDYLQRLRKVTGDAAVDTPPNYAEENKARLERNAFHQRMRQRSYPPEVTNGSGDYKPETDAELRALAEAKQLQDQYMARKELYRETGDPGLLANAGGYGQPNPNPNPTDQEGIFGRRLGGEPEFVRRMYDNNPPRLDNGDGSFSTHSMASATIGNMEIAYPTVVNVNGKLVRLSMEDALSHALKTGEYKRFPSQQDADIYARGAWKDGLGPMYRGDE
jgi:hypothetical protein